MNSQISETELSIRRKLKDDFSSYAKLLEIRTKEGGFERLVMNDTQAALHARLEKQRLEKGRVRAIVLKGRQQGCCLGRGTRVLRADLTWMNVEDVEPGDELVACDESSPVGRGACRKMRTTAVEATAKWIKQTYRIDLDDGRFIVCTGDHRWLTRKSNTQTEWRTVAGERNPRRAIVVGTQIRWVTKPWDVGGYEDGWMGGLLDGEGTIATAKESGFSASVTQRPGEVLNRVIRYAEARGYHYNYSTDNQPKRRSKFGGAPVDRVEFARMDEIFRLLGQTRPTRFIQRRFWEGKALPGKASGIGWATVTSITPLGRQVVYDLQTTHKTFIAEGFVSHNSTYIGGRFYWRVTHRKGVRAFILSHTDESTSNLYGMVDRYHASMNPLMRPETGASNARELYFSKLGSGYRVATAGGKDVGRSHTVQYVHGSEVAFWANAEQHIAGLMQAVPKTGETEVVLESTANGLGGAYHSLWVAAERGETEFEPIFLPWHMHGEYVAPCPTEWQPGEMWTEYGHAHNLTREQLHWAWRESREMGRAIGADSTKPCWMFRQEYPATASEAFQVAGESPFIPPEKVMAARHGNVVGAGPLVFGVDPARDGKDGTGVIDRQGRRLGQRICERWRDGDLMTTAGRVARLIQQHRPARVFIDVGGLGAGLYDRLVELGYDRIVEAVNFGSSPVGAGPDRADHYANRRAEMWDGLRAWFNDAAGVQCPDMDELQMDICAPAWGKGATRWDSSNRLVLEPKDHIRERLNLSPDLGDAAALTFAAPTYADDYGRELDNDDLRFRRNTANAHTGY